VFNSDIPNQHSLLSRTSSYYLKLRSHDWLTVQYISWSQDRSTSLHIFKSISQTFTPSVNHAWQYYQTPKFTVVSEQFCLQNNLCNLKSKIVSSHCNFSTLTLVPPLETPFNTISCFSDYLAYLPNTPWHSRWIHQRGHSSLRFPSSTIHPSQTVLPVSGPSIVPADNDSN